MSQICLLSTPQESYPNIQYAGPENARYADITDATCSVVLQFINEQHELIDQERQPAQSMINHPADMAGHIAFPETQGAHTTLATLLGTVNPQRTACDYADYLKVTLDRQEEPREITTGMISREELANVEEEPNTYYFSKPLLMGIAAAHPDSDPADIPVEFGYYGTAEEQSLGIAVHVPDSEVSHFDVSYEPPRGDVS